LSSSRFTAVAVACLALAAAGCGLGPGGDVGHVSLTVTRDYGSVALRPPATDEASEADTVMRVLERNADISTLYGGGFVQSIDGLEGASSGAGPMDWFFYVNGVESTVGAAEYPVEGGEAIWWDYRDWGAAMRVPAVVGSWPQPLSGGYGGERHPITLECLGGAKGGAGACALARERLAAAGVQVSGSRSDDAIRILVGPWAAVRDDPAASRIEDGPEASGVFAEFRRDGRGYALVPLGQDGEPARPLGPDAGLVAATRHYESPPVWVVSGGDAAGTLAAARLLDTGDLRDHYAVAAEAGKETPLPVR
jgi:hypothetical protein